MEWKKKSKYGTINLRITEMREDIGLETIPYCEVKLGDEFVTEFRCHDFPSESPYINKPALEHQAEEYVGRHINSKGIFGGISI